MYFEKEGTQPARTINEMRGEKIPDNGGERGG
jgi:hypothetical protein